MGTLVPTTWGQLQITEKDWEVQRPRAQQAPLLGYLLAAMGSQGPLISSPNVLLNISGQSPA